MKPQHFSNIRFGKPVDDNQIISGDIAHRTDAPDCISCKVNANNIHLPKQCKSCIKSTIIPLQ